MWQRIVSSARKTAASKSFIGLSGAAVGSAITCLVMKRQIGRLEAKHEESVSALKTSLSSLTSRATEIQKSVFGLAERRMDERLKKEMPEGFATTLWQRGAFIQGSYLLSAVTNQQTWGPSDIDVFVPSAEVMWELRTLLTNQGYASVPVLNAASLTETMQPPSHKKELKPIQLVLKTFVNPDFTFLNLIYDKSGIVVNGNLREVCDALFSRSSQAIATQPKAEERKSKYEKRGFSIVPAPTIKSIDIRCAVDGCCIHRREVIPYDPYCS